MAIKGSKIIFFRQIFDTKCKNHIEIEQNIIFGLIFGEKIKIVIKRGKIIFSWKNFRQKKMRGNIVGGGDGEKGTREKFFTGKFFDPKK